MTVAQVRAKISGILSGEAGGRGVANDKYHNATIVKEARALYSFGEQRHVGFTGEQHTLLTEGSGEGQEEELAAAFHIARKFAKGVKRKAGRFAIFLPKLIKCHRYLCQNHDQDDDFFISPAARASKKKRKRSQLSEQITI